MILRHEFFKKVLIGSIFVLQLTVAGPTSNVLAVKLDTDKTPDYALMSLNTENLETHFDAFIEKYSNELNDTKEEIKNNNRKLKEINSYLKDKIAEDERDNLEKKSDYITQHNEKLYTDASEISEKLNKVLSEKNEMTRKAKRYEESSMCHIL